MFFYRSKPIDPVTFLKQVENIKKGDPSCKLGPIEAFFLKGPNIRELIDEQFPKNPLLINAMIEDALALPDLLKPARSSTVLYSQKCQRARGGCLPDNEDDESEANGL